MAESEAKSPSSIEEYLNFFSKPDAVLEPECASIFEKYLAENGDPEEAKKLLIDNYNASAHLVNFMAESMIYLGCEVVSLQNLVEETMKNAIVKQFDQTKCDAIFMSEQATPAWVAELIAFSVWRNLIYELAEQFPDCLFLNFAIKLICDAGLQDEIRKSVKVVSQQHDVFAKVLFAAIGTILTDSSENYEKNLEELTQLACHAEFNYLYTQVLLSKLSSQVQVEKMAFTLKRIAQDLQLAAGSKFEHDIISVSLLLQSSYPPPFSLLASNDRPDISEYFNRQNQVISAIRSMINRGSLTPADMMLIYEAYGTKQPTNQPSQSVPAPPISLLRQLEFIDMVVDTCYKPGAKINPDYRSKYFYILALAATVAFDAPAPSFDSASHIETRRSSRSNLTPDELTPTRQMLERLYTITSENRPLSELLPELNQLLQMAKTPILGFSLLSWLKQIFGDASFFVQNSDQSPPLHYVLLDELATLHPFLHDRILKTLIKLFESSHLEDDLETIIQLQVEFSNGIICIFQLMSVF